MKKLRLFKSVGQSTTEYAVLLAVVAAALVAMQVYIKRGIQGRIRDLADQITPLSEHYESGQTDTNSITTQSGNVIVQYTAGIVNTNQDEDINRSNNVQVIPEEE